jgi:hypothetical protein
VDEDYGPGSVLRPVGVKPYKTWTPEQVFDLEPPEWLIDYVLPKEGSVLLYGSTNTGKSLLALDWAFRLAQGWKWNGLYVAEPKRVLYIYAEGGHDLQLRYQAWLEGNNVQKLENLEDNLLFVGLDEEIKLRWNPDFDEVPAGVQRLFATAQDFDPDVVVFDPAQEVWRGMDGNSDRDVQMALRIPKELKRRHGAASIIVHHTRKDGDVYRGATSWLDLTDVGFVIAEDQNVQGLVTVKNTKNRYADKGRSWMMHRAVQQLERVPKLLGMESVFLTKGEAVESEASREERVVAMLRKAPATYSEIGSEVWNNAASSGVSRVLEKLKRDGVIEKAGTSRLDPYRLVAVDEPEEL